MSPATTIVKLPRFMWSLDPQRFWFETVTVELGVHRNGQVYVASATGDDGSDVDLDDLDVELLLEEPLED